jgi:hypothetical protein
MARDGQNFYLSVQTRATRTTRLWADACLVCLCRQIKKLVEEDGAEHRAKQELPTATEAVLLISRKAERNLRSIKERSQ